MQGLFLSGPYFPVVAKSAPMRATGGQLIKLRFLSTVRFALLGVWMSLWAMGAQALGVGEIELKIGRAHV